MVTTRRSRRGEGLTHGGRSLELSQGEGRARIEKRTQVPAAPNAQKGRPGDRADTLLAAGLAAQITKPERHKEWPIDQPSNPHCSQWQVIVYAMELPASLERRGAGNFLAWRCHSDAASAPGTDTGASLPQPRFAPRPSRT